MRALFWCRVSFPLLAVLPLTEARTAAPCGGLPRLQLQIFDITAPEAQIIKLPAEAIERHPPGDLASRRFRIRPPHRAPGQSGRRELCVRQAMLDHEAAHIRALDTVVDEFIDRRTAEITRGVTAYKATSAPTADTVKNQWEAGLHAAVTAMRLELLEAL